MEITHEVLARLGPYRLQHINRFGHYTLDLRRKTMNLDLRSIITPVASMD